MHLTSLISGLALLTLASAGTTTSATTALPNPTTAASGVEPGAGIDGYKYVGCYNETTGYAASGYARALIGSTEDSATLTTDSCLKFCYESSYQYCGMEYGRECYGSADLNVYSTELSSSKCDYACVGNASEVCGGSLAITLYNLTSSSTTSGAAGTGNMAWGVGASLALVGGMSAVFAAL